MRAFIRKIPGSERLYRFVRLIVNLVRSYPYSAPFLSFFPPGHFYSPIPNMNEVITRQKNIFREDVREIPGVDLNKDGQLSLVNEFTRYYQDLNLPDEPDEAFRYYYNNIYFSYHDAFILYAFLRHFKTKRILEVGSGHSSALMMDLNERYLDHDLQLTFIDPHPENLHAFMRQDDRERYRLIPSAVQAVSLEHFDMLEGNDILFVDSSHVGKIGSDVLHILFEILPRLRSGVIIHFHDVHWPFEYPKWWIEDGRAWNEAYFLRALLMYNQVMRIRYFNAYIAEVHSHLLSNHMPRCLKHPGSSIWIQKDVGYT